MAKYCTSRVLAVSNHRADADAGKKNVSTKKFHQSFGEKNMKNERMDKGENEWKEKGKQDENNGRGANRGESGRRKMKGRILKRRVG